MERMRNICVFCGSRSGVIPKPMTERELAHETVTRLHVVSSMHERKALMASLSDAFIALPGGYGTLEELFEVIAWAQLGIHRKPIGLLNVVGFFDGLISFVDHTIAAGFVKSRYRGLFVTAERALPLLDALQRHQPPPTRRWLTQEET